MCAALRAVLTAARSLRPRKWVTSAITGGSIETTGGAGRRRGAPIANVGMTRASTYSCPGIQTGPSNVTGATAANARGIDTEAHSIDDEPNDLFVLWAHDAVALDAAGEMPDM